MEYDLTINLLPEKSDEIKILPTILLPYKIREEKWMSNDFKNKIKKIPAIKCIIDLIKSELSKHTSIGSKVFLIKSGTGSGKSTIIPVEIWQELGGNCIVTEPRIITAQEIPYDIVRRNKKFIMGKNIGYQTGPISKRNLNNGILFATIGILRQQLTDRTWVANKYKVIIIDEVHESDVIAELTLAHIKLMLMENYNSKVCPIVILMSATLPIARLQSYFKVPENHIITVEGLSYPIEKRFAENSITNYINGCLEIIKFIHCDEDKCNNFLDNKLHDILIFVKGIADVNLLIEEIEKLTKIAEIKKYGLIRSYGITRNTLLNMPDLINSIMLPTIFRKIIVATNIAETGLTIPTLAYVLDTGYVRKVTFDPTTGAKVNIVSNITKFMAEQRMGRCGRVGNGTAYLLYTEDSYNQFEDDQLPKFIIEEITEALLNIIIITTSSKLEQNGNSYTIKYESEFDIKKLDLVSFPPFDSIRYSLNKLLELGFIDSNCIPTVIGHMASRFKKIRFESIRMIFAGYYHDANILDLITIAAILETGRSHVIDVRKYKSNTEYSCEFIDMLCLFKEYIYTIKKSKKYANVIAWAQTRHVNIRALQIITELRDEIITIMLLNKMDPFRNKDRKDMENIKKCIHDGFKEKTIIFDKYLQKYVSKKYHFVVYIDSMLHDKPSELVAAEIILQEKGKRYDYIASCISIVD